MGKDCDQIVELCVIERTGDGVGCGWRPEVSESLGSDLLDALIWIR